MPHVSRNTLSKATENQLIKTLRVIFTGISKDEEMKVFFSALLSDTEQLMLAKRVAIILLLSEGYESEAIAHALHVTRGTVDRLQLFYESRGSGYRIAFNMLAQKQQEQTIKKLAINLLGYAARAAGGRVKSTIL